MATQTKSTKAEFIQKMYMQINNIAQGFAIAILIEALAERFMNTQHKPVADDFYILTLALTSLMISLIFWTRYYLDTECIQRSFKVRSVTWFFLYIVSEGFSFRQITEPVNWLISTGIFLGFGFGFYILNLSEIPVEPANASETGSEARGLRRMRRRMATTFRTLFHSSQNYRDWQKERLVDLVMLCGLTFAGAWLVSQKATLIYPVSVVTLIFAVWQLSKSRDYRKYGFLDRAAAGEK